MGIQYPSSIFYSLSGLQNQRAFLERTGQLRHSVVHTEEDTGGLRVVHINIERHPDIPGRLTVSAHYLLHSETQTNHAQRFLRLVLDEGDDIVEIKQAEFMGRKIDVRDDDILSNVIRAFNRFYEMIALRNEWVNFIKIFRQALPPASPVGQKPLPGLYANGEIKNVSVATAKQKPTSGKGPHYPALFFHTIIGCGPEHYSLEDTISHSFTVRDPDTGKLFVWNYVFEQGKTPLHVTMKCDLTVIDHSGQSSQTYPLYHLKSQPHGTGKKSARLSKLQMYHPNAPESGMETVDLNDMHTVSAALKSIRMLNRTIRHNMVGLEHDYRKPPQARRLFFPTDIMTFTGLTEAMIPSAATQRKAGRLVYTLGGQSSRRIFSSYDQHIGANSYRYDYYRTGAKNPESLIVDMGGLFHDNFDLTFTNLSRYFRHRTSPRIRPKTDVQAVLLTHGHKDHTSQIAYLVKCGYILPHLVMLPLTLRRLRREMRELGIDKKIQQEVLDKCLVVEHDTIPINTTSEAPYIVEGDGKKIELFWEKLESDRLGQFEQHPVMRVGDFTVRIGPMPHSDPGFMYEIITPAGSHLHTGDFKMDPTIQLYAPSLRRWLTGVRSKAVSIDATGTTRPDDARTPTEAEIQASIVKLFQQHPERRFICPILGSNTARLTTLIAAMGQVGKKTLILDGKALEDLLDDLNAVHNLSD